jgi:hypothetical protein
VYKALPFYSLSPKKIPVNKNYLFLGRGFEWNQSHTQRVEDTKHAKNKEYLTPSTMFTIDIPIENPIIATGISNTGLNNDSIG